MLQGKAKVVPGKGDWHKDAIGGERSCLPWFSACWSVAAVQHAEA